MTKYFAFASDGWFPRIGYDSGDYEIATTVDGGRTLDNFFIGQVVGPDKIKYNITFPDLSVEETKEFLQRFDRDLGGRMVQDFDVYDPRLNAIVRKTMYVGNRSGKPFKVHANGTPERWLSSKANLIEV